MYCFILAFMSHDFVIMIWLFSPFGLTNEITECIRYLLLENTQYSASYKFMNINIVQLMNLSYQRFKFPWKILLI